MPRRRLANRRSWFYTGLTVFLLVVVIAGFWPRYYGPLLQGKPVEQHLQHWGIPLHSAINLGWILLFLLQAMLVWQGRPDLHRRFGPLIAAYGVLLIILGLFTGLAVEAHRVELGGKVDQAAVVIFFVVRDLVMFGGFLAAGIIYRKKPDIHKALMFLATWSLVMVGAGRLIGRQIFPYVPLWIAYLILLSPIILVMCYDMYQRRRLQPVYVIGLVLYFLRIYYGGLGRSEIWRKVARALLQPFL
jgi:hypothetical protein